MAGELSEKVSGQEAPIRSVPKKPGYENYLLYGGAIGGISALIGNCSYWAREGYIKRGLDFGDCELFGVAATAILSHPVSILGIAGGALAGAAVCYATRKIRCRQDGQASDAADLENRL